MATALISRLTGAIKGDVTPPGDKSISHRALIFGTLAKGTTNIRNLLDGDDIHRTLNALREVGADISKKDFGWQIKGVGVDKLTPFEQTLEMGNSGTGARLLIGLLSGRPFTSSFVGDESLSRRPMDRIITPLEQMGAVFKSENGKLPLSVTGPKAVKPISYRLPVASAQVKSAILLAGLSAEGVTTVIEPTPTRDHTENMLRALGARIEITKQPDGAEAIAITGNTNLMAKDITVPADLSSAAFPIVAALLRPGSDLTLRNVGINPRRSGLIETLVEMGANITLSNRKTESGEPVADINVKHSTLKAITVPPERAPSMIDEYPVLAMAAACANGTTRMRGLGELRHKESDRLKLTAEGLKRCGVKVLIEGDDLFVQSNGVPPTGGATIETSMDHRIAMSFLVLGTAARQPIKIDDGDFIATSFPDFVGMMNGLGASIKEE